MAVGQLADKLGESLATVSHHLQALYNGELVDRRRTGNVVLYSLKKGIYQSTSAPEKTWQIDLGCCVLRIPESR